MQYYVLIVVVLGLFYLGFVVWALVFKREPITIHRTHVVEMEDKKLFKRLNSCLKWLWYKEGTLRTYKSLMKRLHNKYRQKFIDKK